MRILIPALLGATLFASPTFGVEITRRTKLATVTLLIDEHKQPKQLRAPRYWGSREGTPSLRYPALAGISYSTELESFRFPSKLIAGIGALDLQVLLRDPTQVLTVRDSDEWIVITLSGSDGASGYEVQWRLHPGLGWIIRFAHDGELPGNIGDPYGPEVLGGQAIVVSRRKLAP
jgi:hypothetical protein